MTKSKLSKIAGILMIITIISKLIGFVRDALIASSFGASYQTDAYTMSLTIPYMFFELFGLTITTTFIPILSESYIKKGKKEMFNLANSILNILIIITIFASILGWLFAPIIVKMLAPKFNEVTYNLTVQLTKLSIINILFLSLNSGLTAVVQALDEFVSPAIVGIVMNIPIIFYIIFGKSHNIVELTIVTILGNAIQILVYLPWLIRNRYKYKFYINLHDSRIKKMLYLISPILIGIGVEKINSIVNRIMASGLAQGSITALDYANKVNYMVYFTFAQAIITVIYPSLSREGASENLNQFKQYLIKAFNSINLLMIPCSVGMLVLRIPIINILFKHGSFDDRAVNMTSTALLYLVIGMIFYSIRDVGNRAFYALQDTRTPMINGIFGVIINIILNITLVNIMGIGGLTLSTSISAIVTSILLIYRLRKKIGSINLSGTLKSLGKILLASIVMGTVINILRIYISNNITGLKADLFIVALSIFLGIFVYGIILLILREQEFILYFKNIKSKILLIKEKQ
ncbi:murein biosynthesis integral membrane protein MurJ [Clostridium sp. SYSU_GA19001]|uniref:murein biosynthesis integral membrane protein MurJ n=1 Tax=Clostridium caldaquaticum TaxID=2940653 RepID=UPI0020773202|nr:murein biosynthesis integral membrane protein MurJ [Clostridium caldaquaticum]MCM8711286.1 murein biosynthesis integral membrane protein MurJ [Clostridium caldaquaticum]